MAKVWMVKEGSEPTHGGPWRVMSLSDCCDKLNLQPTHFRCGLDAPPKFGGVTAPRVMFRDPRFVVVQLDEGEADLPQWRAGFYLADLTPKEAERRCLA